MKLRSKLFVLLAPTLILILLGTWQISRLRFKNQLIANMSLPPITLSASDLSLNSYRRVEFYGHFINNKIYVFAGNAGYYSLAPFLIKNSGTSILINCGTGHDKQDFLLSETETKVNGVLYCPRNQKVRWLIKNDPESNSWFWFDTISMAKHLALNLSSCILWADQETAMMANLSPNAPLAPFNKHLEYAITWYILAASWMLMFSLLFFQKTHNY